LAMYRPCFCFNRNNEPRYTVRSNAAIDATIGGRLFSVLWTGLSPGVGCARKPSSCWGHLIYGHLYPI
jgi:hypothetical protein